MSFGWVLLLDVGTRMVDGESRSEAQKGGEDEKEVGPHREFGRGKTQLRVSSFNEEQ